MAEPEPSPEPVPPRRVAPVDLIDSGGKVDREALFSLYEQSEDAAGDDESPITVRFELQRDLEKRLDRYLVDRIPFLSRTSLQNLIREQAVTVNGRVPKPSTKLRRGDVVVAALPPPPSTEIPAENIPLDVIYEDDDLIVINKPDDIIVHPARGNKSGTIINALAWHFRHRTSGALSTVGEEFARPGVVHRLDRHTTGVMVAAKSDTAHWRLGKQFEHRQTEKRYLAVVHGRMEPHADVIDLPLGKHPTLKEKYAVRWDATGKPSVTIYRVREVYDGYTLVELELKTGRTHQIRVHLSHIGYPIVGDDMYGGKHLRVADVAGFTQSPGMDMPGLSCSPNDSLITRQALHAALLGFAHPMSNQPMTFQAPLHADMRLLIQLLRQHKFIAAPNVAGAVLDLARIIPP
jgi:23S rRNA pseudouridine1911/1915/1917 synthase